MNIARTSNREKQHHVGKYLKFKHVPLSPIPVKEVGQLPLLTGLLAPECRSSHLPRWPQHHWRRPEFARKLGIRTPSTHPNSWAASNKKQMIETEGHHLCSWHSHHWLQRHGPHTNSAVEQLQLFWLNQPKARSQPHLEPVQAIRHGGRSSVGALLDVK